jgi:RNA polymerase sigma-70 factor (ECF subfamily)
MNTHETRAAQLFLSHHGFVRGVALKHAPWPGLVEDIVQQVFLEFMAKETQWDLESDVRPLLATMARHVALRHWRERTREKPETIQKLAKHIRQLAEEREHPTTYVDEIGALRDCLLRLPDKSRELVQRYYFDERSTREIGADLAMNPDTICRALSRVRDSLRECIARALKPNPARANV